MRRHAVRASILMGDVSVAALALASAFVAVAALIQSSIGFGFALVAVPALALIHPDLVPVPLILLSLVLTMSTVVRERRSADWPAIRWVIGGRIPGTIAGLALIKVVAPATLQTIIGAVILLAVVLVLLRGYGHQRNHLSEVIAGAASGAMHMIAAISGPPLALLFAQDRGPTLRATLGAIFFLGGLLTLGVRAVGGEVNAAQLALAGALTPALLLGFWTSRFLIHRVQGPLIRAAVLVFAGTGGLLLLVRSLTA